jgi:ABC-2 type transport system permease protein
MNTDTTHRSVRPATAVRLVAQRELNTRLRTRGFVIGTIVILAVMVGYLAFQASMISGSDQYKVGLTEQSSGVAAPLQANAQQLGLQVDTVPLAGPDGGRAQVESGELDAVVSGSGTDLQVLVKSDLDQQLRVLFDAVSQQQALDARLAAAGQDPAEVRQAIESVQVQVNAIDPPDPAQGQRLVVGLVMMFLLYMSITTYGALVAQGVVEEKSSRIVEILLSTVRPWHLLLGKVIGLGLVGLVQLFVIAGIGLVMATVTGVLTISGVAVVTLLWGLLWYLLGFFLYATVFAAAGSLVSRQEDTQSVLTPITIVLVVGFIAGFTVVQDPDSTSATVLSLVPLLSPILMPTRIAAGSAGALEVVAALLLTIAAIAALTWLGARIYQRAVLRTGSRVKLTDVLRS